jgi:GAF domain-containing protein
MAESISISATTKASRYEELLPQIVALLEGETDLIANLANTSSALHMAFAWHWVGFYLVKKGELVLGPFQGPVACTRIAFGRGVCGQAWKRKQTIVVPDVNQFEGHIACSSLSQSEIVVPICKAGEVVGVLDIDSLYLNDFNQTDQHFLEELATLLASYF